MGRLTIAALPCLAAVALRAAEAQQQGITRDSAGVSIVEHRAASATPVAFTLSPLPTLAIGGLSGDPNYEFSSSVPTAVRFADGRIVVADIGMRTIRVYSREGRFLTSIGRFGPGPGEYTRPEALHLLPGDTIAVIDRTRADGISLFTADGGYRRHERTRPTGIVSLLDSGDWLTRAGGGSSGDSIRVYRRSRRDSASAGEPGPPRGPPAAPPPTYSGQRGMGTAETGKLIAVLPGSARRVDTTRSPAAPAGLPAAGRGTNVVISAAPFAAPPPIIVGLPDGFLYGDATKYEIRELAADGMLRRIIRRDVDLRLTRDDVDRYKASLLAGAEGDARRAMERRLDSLQVPRNRPAFQRILVDRARRTWVQDYEAVADVPLQWTVFDSTGKMLGTVTTPAKFRVFDIGADYILGRWRDADGVAYIQLFTLTPKSQ